MEIAIRIAEKKDAPLIAYLGHSTFIEAYAAKNSAENMKHYLASNFTIERTTLEFDEPTSIFFLATFNDEPAGYAKLRCVEDLQELEGTKHMELARIYVQEKFHRKKIGKALMNICINHSKEFGYEILWLGVWKQNDLAIEFYKRNGFTIFGEHIFQFGNEAQVDWMMKLIL